jgi:DNA repair protein RadC
MGVKFLLCPPKDTQDHLIKMSKNSLTYIGHRERAQDKLLKTEDLDTVADYELLELILMKAIPRRDVKPLAKEMLTYFGSIGKVLTASSDELEQFPYVKKSTVSLFKLIVEANRRMLETNLQEAPVLKAWDTLLDYCCLTLQYERIERCMVLYLDTQYRLMRREIKQNGTIDRVAVYPREIVKKALLYGASSVVVVHNHPSGWVEPSESDFKLTTEIYHALDAVRIQLIDHLIIGEGRRIYSFGANGHLTVAPKYSSK